MKLALSKAAERDLAGIIGYTTEVHGWPMAANYARNLQAAMERLEEYPELGTGRLDLAPAVRSLPCREHIIFYRLSAKTILIVRILHKAMDAHRWLKP